MINEELVEKAKKIKLLLLDCDGVLTDGKLYFTENGESIKVFHVRDGQGLVNWHKAGFLSGIISGRSSQIVERRANELGIRYIKQGSYNKVLDFEDILKETNLTAEETAFIGDDLPDIPLLKLVGLPVAVSDAVEAVRSEAYFVTNKNGGNGAVRELCDFLLTAKY